MSMRFNTPVFRPQDNKGRTLPGAQLFFYENYSTTPKTTYANVALTNPNPHPIIADGAGKFTDIFLGIGDYRVILTDRKGQILWDRNDVSTNDLTESVINDIERQLTEVLNLYRMQNLGEYGVADPDLEKTFTEPNAQYVVYNNQAYWTVSGTPLPYTTDSVTYPNAQDDPNLTLTPQVTFNYVDTGDQDRQKETTGLSEITLVNAGDDLFPLIGQGIRVAGVGLWVVPSVTADGSPMPNPALLDAIPTSIKSTINGGTDVILDLPSTQLITRDSITINVPSDYDTINDALQSAFYRYSVTGKDDALITINLETGFVMSEQVFANGIDLSKFIITSTDPIVTIDRSSLTDTITNLDFDSTPAFLAVNGGVLPIISALFDMDTSGVADTSKQHGVMVAWGGTAIVQRGYGVTNCTGRGYYGVNGIMYGRECNFSGAGTYGCRPGNASVCNVRDGNFDDCGEYGLYSAGSSVVACQGATMKNAGLSALRADFSSSVLADGFDGSGSLDRGLDVRGGATVKANDAILTNCAGRAVDVTEASIVTISNADLSDSGDRAINANQNSAVNAQGVTATGALGDSAVASFSGSEVNIVGSSVSSPNAPGNNLRIGQGGEIIAHGVSCTFSVVPNKIGSDGIIYTDDVTTNKGQDSILAASTSVTVNHGLTVTPFISDIQVTPANLSAASQGFYVSNVTATTFDINSEVAVGGNAQYNWFIQR